MKSSNTVPVAGAGAGGESTASNDTARMPGKKEIIRFIVGRIRRRNLGKEFSRSRPDRVPPPGHQRTAFISIR